MITLLSIQTVAPGREADYVAIQQKLWRLTQEQESEHVVRYEHYRDTKPNQFVSLLTFSSLEAFLAHQVAPYHDDVDWEGLFVVHEMQWLDPLPGANDLSQTLLPALPDDLDPAQRVYADMLPADRPAWWGGPQR